MLRIEAPHYVAGIEPGVKAAPILYWMIQNRWTAEQIKNYCLRKKYIVEEIT